MRSDEMIFNCKQYAADTLMPAYADQRSRISIVIAGQLLEQVNQNEQFAAAGSLVIKPGHVVHQNKVGPNGARTLSIELPEPLAKISSGNTLHCVLLPEQGSLVAICANGNRLTQLAEQKHFPTEPNTKPETLNQLVAGQEPALP